MANSVTPSWVPCLMVYKCLFVASNCSTTSEVVIKLCKEISPEMGLFPVSGPIAQGNPEGIGIHGEVKTHPVWLSLCCCMLKSQLLYITCWHSHQWTWKWANLFSVVLHLEHQGCNKWEVAIEPRCPGVNWWICQIPAIWLGPRWRGRRQGCRVQCIGPDFCLGLPTPEVLLPLHALHVSGYHSPWGRWPVMSRDLHAWIQNMDWGFQHELVHPRQWRWGWRSPLSWQLRDQRVLFPIPFQFQNMSVWLFGTHYLPTLSLCSCSQAIATACLPFNQGVFTGQHARQVVPPMPQVPISKLPIWWASSLSGP